MGAFMRKWIIALFVITFWLIPYPASSQENVQLSTLEVDLWPEYDRPSVLVIYHITLSDETQLPTELIFQIPTAAGEPNAVAIQQPDGQLFSTDYRTQINGKWELVTFTTTFPEVQIEYYDPNLKTDGEQRSFTYNWPGDYAVGKMAVQIQLPVGASDMVITPGPANSQTGADGMTYYLKDIGQVDAGETFSIEFTYQKTSSQLSVESLTVEPSAPLTSGDTFREKIQAAIPWLFPEEGGIYKVVPWLLGLLAMALLVGGGIWYWRSGREEKAPKRSRHSRRSKVDSETPSMEAGNIYCHQCGKRANSGDRFCRSCGTRLRVE
jgi:hypothetical protein